MQHAIETNVVLTQLTEQIDDLLKSLEVDIRTAKTFSDKRYQENCISVCRRTRDEMYQIHLDFIEETMSNVSTALTLPESDKLKRQELFESWEMIFNSMIIRCGQIGGPVQLLLHNICKTEVALRPKYSSLLILTGGCFVMLLGLAVTSSVVPVLAPFSPLLATVGAGTGAAVAALGAVVTAGVGRHLTNHESHQPTIKGTISSDIEKKLDQLVHISKQEKEVWFSNDMSTRLLKDLELSAHMLRKLQANMQDWQVL